MRAHFYHWDDYTQEWLYIGSISGHPSFNLVAFANSELKMRHTIEP
jgi:hypothetical protein